MKPPLLVLAVVAVGACRRPDTTLVLRVSAPARVSVERSTARGGEVLLPPSVVGATEPANDVALAPGVWLSRRNAGGVVLRCDACTTPGRVLLGDDGTATVTLPDPRDPIAPPPPRWSADGDAFHLRIDLGPAPGDGSPRAIDLVTPRANVVELRRRREDLRGWGLAHVGIGLVLAAAPAFFFYEAATGRDHDQAVLFGGLGAFSLVLPVVFVCLGVGELASPPPYDVRLWPAQP